MSCPISWSNHQERNQQGKDNLLLFPVSALQDRNAARAIRSVVLGNSGTSFPVTFADVEISQSAVSPGDSTVVCRGRSARRTYSEPLMTRSGAGSPYGDT